MPTVCTPCGSKEHQSNDRKCPEHVNRETAILSKRPEGNSPYHITHERWTWRVDNTTPPPHLTNSLDMNANVDPNPPQNRQKLLPNPTKRPARQPTLASRGFHPSSNRTGADSTPIGPRPERNPEAPTPPPSAAPRLDDTQQPTQTKNVQRADGPDTPNERRNTEQTLPHMATKSRKSLIAHHDLLAKANPRNRDIIALQEPYIGHLELTRGNTHWNVIYPSNKNNENKNRIRCVMLLNTDINPNRYSK
jgi:hypothetical protein